MAPTADDMTQAMPLSLSYSTSEDSIQDMFDVNLLENIEEELEEIGETEESRQSSLESLGNWVQANTSITNCRMDASFLLRFIRMQKHQIGKSCALLENYLRMRKTYPQWFKNLDIKDEKVNELVKSGYVFALPGRDPQGRRVIFCKAQALDPYRHTNSDQMRAFIITFEALLEEEESQLRGFTYVFDCSGVSLAHITLWSPVEVRKMFNICQKNLPMRHKDINLVALPFPMRAVLEFCKSLLSEKIKSRLSSFSGMDKLWNKMGDCAPELLPKEYGGKMPLSEMTELWIQNLNNRRSSLLRLDEIDIAEPKPKVLAKSKEIRSSIWNYLPSFSPTSSSGSI